MCDQAYVNLGTNLNGELLSQWSKACGYDVTMLLQSCDWRMGTLCMSSLHVSWQCRA